MALTNNGVHTHNYWDIFFSETVDNNIWSNYYRYPNHDKFPGLNGLKDTNNSGYQIERTTTNNNSSINIEGSTASNGGTETRPVNYGANYIIKY